LIFSNFLKP